MGKIKIIIVLIAILMCTFMAHGSNIHDAALKGDLEKVKTLLKENGELLEAPGKHQKRPLHWAAQGGHKAIVALLVKKGARVNVKNSEEETPFHYAAAIGNREIAEFLLKAGANIDAKTKQGHRAVDYAVMRNNYDMFRLLMDKGAEIILKRNDGRTLLHDAAWDGSREMLEVLVEKGISVNAKTSSNRTPLHNAIYRGNVEAVKFFIERGADVNARHDNGPAPLGQAVENGYKKVVFHLLNAGAHVGDGYLHQAAARGYGKIVGMLLAKGADPNKKDEKGMTPLNYACRYNHKKAASLLLSKGADKEDLKKKFGHSRLLKKELGDGNALVWYLGHSGWAVKTGKNLLIFDYYKRYPSPDTPFIANGNVNPEEIKDLDVTVFVSHEHQDHFMPRIFEWSKQVGNIDYVLGFKPKDIKDGYIFLGPRQEKKLKGLNITTLESNDSGVAFFVEVDGVNVFHSGDHANRKRDFSGPFKKEIDFLAKKGLKPDIFFAPVNGCNFGDRVAVKKGVYYTIKKLSPRAVFPMHAGGVEERLVDFAREAVEAGFKTPMCCPNFNGDYFFVGSKGVKGALKSKKAKLVKKEKCKKTSCRAKSK